MAVPNPRPGSGVPGQPGLKPVTMGAVLPIRNYTYTKTVDFVAGTDVLGAFGCVNQNPFLGLPKGYWLMTALSGETVDDSITYTYSATWSTKQKEDWSQFAFLEDDHGHPLPINESDLNTLRVKEYDYSIDDSVMGIIKVGMYPIVDFFPIFGIS